MPKPFVRTSKFRHIYGDTFKKEHWYDGIQVTTNSHDSSFAAVNAKFVAVVLESGGGGSFLVLPIKKTGRIETNHPKICGHKNRVSDIKWNPFNDNIIASASEDCTVKLWEVPDHGLISDLHDCVVDLVGHQRRVSNITWHPTANNILASVGFDYCLIIWDTGRGEPVHVLSCHPDVVNNISWSLCGDQLVTTCRDKKIRIIDPRKESVIMEAQGHQGTKGSHVCFIKKNLLLTTGFSLSNQREIAVWDTGNMASPVLLQDIDYGTSPLYIFLDKDTDLVFFAGRGDGNIRYYELSFDPLHLHFLSEFRSPVPQRGLTAIPKRSLNVNNCEIYRFYKLHTNALEPISMIVPRKDSSQFHSDLYPMTQGDAPSLEACQWLQGRNADPILISLESGYQPTNRKFSVSSVSKQKEQTVVESNRVMAPHNEKELREAFYAQQDEIARLKEMLQAKELQIRHLERRLSRSRISS